MGLLVRAVTFYVWYTAAVVLVFSALLAAAYLLLRVQDWRKLSWGKSQGSRNTG
jgi:hypothetical protein